MNIFDYNCCSRGKENALDSLLLNYFPGLQLFFRGYEGAEVEQVGSTSPRRAHVQSSESSAADTGPAMLLCIL